MVMFYALFRKLNRHFDEEGIGDLVKRAHEFAPGEPLDLGFLAHNNPELKAAIASYIAEVPPSLKETFRGVIYQALTSTPARHIVFAWAPAYDFEVTIWDAPCGITVFCRSRYPSDPRPSGADG